MGLYRYTGQGCKKYRARKGFGVQEIVLKEGESMEKKMEHEMDAECLLS